MLALIAACYDRIFGVLTFNAPETGICTMMLARFKTEECKIRYSLPPSMKRCIDWTKPCMYARPVSIQWDLWQPARKTPGLDLEFPSSGIIQSYTEQRGTWQYRSLRDERTMQTYEAQYARMNHGLMEEAR
jgi:hypothetical protein